VGTAFMVLAALGWWRDHLLLPRIFALVGGSLWAAGIVVPGHLGGVHRAWMGFAHRIAKVTSPIFMGIVYFVAIMPIGLVMRTLGRNPIRHREVNDSYWHRRSDESRGQLTNQF
jgi:hypothetical protein